MNQEQINKDLAERESQSSPFQKKVLEYVKSRLKSSSDKMCEHHDQWDRNSHIYRGYRVGNRNDATAVSKGEPPKIIVPVAYAQVQTALSFILSTFTQREQLLEVVGHGPEDVKTSEGMNADLAYQTAKGQHLLSWYFWMLDATKQGFGVVRNDWVTETERMRVQTTVQPSGIMGMLSSFGLNAKPQMAESIEDVTTYEGNRLRNISPYSFYPDPSLPVASFQQGSFVFTEDEVSQQTVKKEEGKTYFGTSKIPESGNRDLSEFRKRRFKGPFRSESGGEIHPTVGKDQSYPYLISEGEFTMSPKDATRQFEMDLGDDPVPCKWLVVIANDQKIIRFEKLANLHGQYNFSLLEFSPDADSFLNPGLVESIYELQTLVNFFLNSHVTNVRKIIANRFIVKEENVNIDDLKNGSIYVRVKGSFAGIDKVIKQLDTSNITQQNVGDMQNIMQIIQQVTGINENALGQYAGGRRSATEARNVNAGAAARMKLTASLMNAMGIEPLARQQLANTRQWRSETVYNQIVGELAVDAPYDQVILADPNKLAGGYDFLPYDATLPSDKQHQAGVLTELFTALIANPNSMQMLNLNPVPMIHHIAKLHGIKNLKDFNFEQMQLPQAQVVPNEQVDQVINQGAEPVDMAGEEVLRQLRGSQ